MAPGSDLAGALVHLREQLRALQLPLPARDATTAQAVRAGALAQIDDYLLPRLASLEAPLLTVVAGSTGSGKSTLVNSLVGLPVTRPGVLRPTTRHPVLVHNPADAHWFVDDRILPQLPRITGGDPGGAPAASSAPDLPGAENIYGLRLVGRSEVPSGLALLDAPDIDSVARANRELAEVLMAAADLWIFVTTAARYSDAVPWDALRGAVARNAAIALVLNRVPQEAVVEVSAHLRALLASEGLAGAPLFVIAETPLVDTMIPDSATRPLAQWLWELGADAAARAAVARRTLDGAIEHLVVRSYELADDADAQWEAGARLLGMVDPPFAAAKARLMAISEDGSLLRGEVLARWQEFVGAGEMFRRMESTFARWRDRMAASFRGEPAPPEQVTQAIETGLAQVLVSELSVACEQVDAAWRTEPAGRALLAGGDLAHPGADAGAAAASLVRDWQVDVLTMIRSEGADRRTTARALAYGVNGAALTLMVLVFATTGGITGAEVGIAGGSAVLAQKVLEAVFSEDAVRRMAGQARDRLGARVDSYLAASAVTFKARVEGLRLEQAAGATLRQAAAAVAMARPEVAGDELPAAPQPAALPGAAAGAVPSPSAPTPGRRGAWQRWFGAGGSR